jgi:hypothetical protein
VIQKTRLFEPQVYRPSGGSNSLFYQLPIVLLSIPVTLNLDIYPAKEILFLIICRLE